MEAEQQRAEEEELPPAPGAEVEGPRPVLEAEAAGQQRAEAAAEQPSAPGAEEDSARPVGYRSANEALAYRSTKMQHKSRLDMSYGEI